MDIDPCSDIMTADDVIQMSSIQMLNIDTLLVIFNFLSLYDKLVGMRVCKIWHQIISKQHAWTVIDFRTREDGPQRKVDESRKQYKRFVSKTGPHVFEYREYGNPWKCLRTATNILTFLKQYARKTVEEFFIGDTIKEVLIYDEIIEYLERNCPNIKILDIPIYKSFKNPRFLINLQFLKELKLYFYCGNYTSDQYLSYISQCSHLQILDITSSDLPLNGIKTLSNMTHLLELDLNITNAFNAAFTEFESTLGELFVLRVFRLTLYTENDFNDFDGILSAIGHWTHLEVLALCTNCAVCEFTSEAFETMVSGLRNLETLELTVKNVTSQGIELIGTYLKKLKSLKLWDEKYDVGVSSEVFEIMVSKLLYLETLQLDGGFVTSSIVRTIRIHLKRFKLLALSRGSYSAESLQTLSHHPTLEKLEVRQSYNLEENWIGKLYSVLATLPEIKQVQMRLKSLQFDDIKNISLVIDSAEVQVMVGTRLWIKEPNHWVIANEKKWKRENAK